MSVNGTNGLDKWVRAVAVVGLPGVIALILIWVSGREIPNIIRMAEANHALMLQIREGQVEGMRMLREQQDMNEALYRLMQRICANAAKNDDDQQRCFDK